MNPSVIAQPAPLFGACMHAGGWPKLGWACNLSEEGLDEEQDGAELG